MAGITDRFQANLTALARYHRALAGILTGVSPGSGFEARESRSRQPVPVYRSGETAVHINSPYDPQKEAQRFSGTVEPSPSYLLLGLEGGYAQRSLLKRETELVIVVDYDIGFLRFLLEHFDYRESLLDPRLRFIVNDSPQDAVLALLDEYLPQFHGNLLAIPWRPRERMNPRFFGDFRTLLPDTLEHCAIDVSTQRKFGRRWMRNLLANAPNALHAARTSYAMLNNHRFRHVHVTAAGPSLELSRSTLTTLPREDCIVATDTSLPFLISLGCEPDFVVSVDCQIYSYHHFLKGIPHDSALVLDLTSPPGLYRFKNPIIPVAGGHPFSRYLSRQFFQFMPIDTSGGNVTHAAVSFADRLEAKEIVLHGVDLCYPGGKLYARGTYLYSYFGALENRTANVETLTARLLLERTDLTRQIIHGEQVTYGTPLLESYRKKLGDFAGKPGAPVIVEQGRKLPPPQSQAGLRARSHRMDPITENGQSWEGFCRKLLADLEDIEIANRPVQSLLADLSQAKRELLYALMPLAAFSINRDDRQRGSQLLAEAVSEARVLLASTLIRHIGNCSVADK